MTIDLQYISNFLSKVEGDIDTIGYIPCFKLDANGNKTGKSVNYTGVGDPALFMAIGESGVTIGMGCDLGQTTAQTMLSYGLSDSIVNSLQPYFQLKKDLAIQKLNTLPLTVSQDVANKITMAVQNGHLRLIVSAYDRDSAVPFADIPKQAQAVIFSLCYQKGCGGVRKDWPKVWSALINQSWCVASEELCTGFKEYANRRKIEGNLLLEIC